MGGIGSGGCRANAGRPPIDIFPRETISLCLPSVMVKNLRGASEQKGVSMSQLVADLLENRI